MGESGSPLDEEFERILGDVAPERRDELLATLAADRGHSIPEIAALTGLDLDTVGALIAERDVEAGRDCDDSRSELDVIASTIQRLTTAETSGRITEILTTVGERYFGTAQVVVYRYDGVAGELVPELARVDGGDDVDPIPDGANPWWSAFRRDEPATVGNDVVVPARGLGIVRFVDVSADVETDYAARLLRPIASVALGTLDRERRIQRLESDVDELAAENERLDEFASIVSHDLRNPLSVAEGNLELAAETGDDEYFEAVAEAHERIDRIVEHTLSVSTEGHRTEDIETVDLESAAETAWQTVETRDGQLRITGTMDVEADPERLQQLFENLFRNAVEHGSRSSRSQAHQDGIEHGPAPEKPTGSASNPDETDPSVTVTVGPLGDDGFFVADDGPGIPESERSMAFERGYSSEDDGTGFGLYIVKEIVDGHRWEIAVTEGDDGGARFEITDVD